MGVGTGLYMYNVVVSHVLVSSCNMFGKIMGKSVEVPVFDHSGGQWLKFFCSTR